MKTGRTILTVAVVTLLAATPAAAPPLGGDANLDGSVDARDFTIVKAHFGLGAMEGDPVPTWSQGNFNGDTVVDALDVSILNGNFGTGGSAPSLDDPSLRLVIDIAQGNLAWLENNTAQPLDFDMYEIWSAGDLLDPVAWVSIDDVMDTDPFKVVLELGPAAVRFGECLASAGLVAEDVFFGSEFDPPMGLTGQATLQAWATWEIGQPAPNPSLQDLEFYYTRLGDVDVKYRGGIEIVPEPASVAILALGAVGVLPRRRRSKIRRGGRT